MINNELADIFNKIADLLEIKGDNPFRIRAYRTAASNILSLGKDVSLMTRDELLDIPGIGSDLAGKIREYLETGRINMLENLKLEYPEGLVSLLGVPGIGPKTAGLIYKRFKVDNLSDLEKLAGEHRLTGIPGIKDKTEANIIKGIRMLTRVSARRPLGTVLPAAGRILDYLSANAPVGKIAIAGSIRRWKETINDIDIIATSEDPHKVMNIFTGIAGVRDVLVKGPTKSSIVMGDGIQVDLRVVDADSFGAALLYFTGSKAHNIKIRELASRSGMKINEYGIFSERNGEKLGGRSEEDIYRILDIAYIEPEMREDTGEVEAAAERSLPRLIEAGDIKGDLHVHTDWSDGSETLEDMIKKPLEMGYGYIAVTDHSKGLGIARGLAEERIIEQRRIIDALNRRSGRFKVLAGAEVDIRADGSLDFGPEILAGLDIVIASVHSGFNQSREQITGRITTAMRNPFVSVICHPTGRLIGEREGYELDMDAVLKAAAETGAAIEINAYPLRLDLQADYVKTAKTMGVQLVISTDAHKTAHFDNMVFGVSVARRGWLEKGDVLNTLNYGNLLKRLKKMRGSR